MKTLPLFYDRLHDLDCDSCMHPELAYKRKHLKCIKYLKYLYSDDKTLQSQNIFFPSALYYCCLYEHHDILEEELDAFRKLDQPEEQLNEIMGRFKNPLSGAALSHNIAGYKRCIEFGFRHVYQSFELAIESIRLKDYNKLSPSRRQKVFDFLDYLVSIKPFMIEVYCVELLKMCVKTFRGAFEDDNTTDFAVWCLRALRERGAISLLTDDHKIEILRIIVSNYRTDLIRLFDEWIASETILPRFEALVFETIKKINRKEQKLDKPSQADQIETAVIVFMKYIDRELKPEDVNALLTFLTELHVSKAFHYEKWRALPSIDTWTESILKHYENDWKKLVDVSQTNLKNCMHYIHQQAVLVCKSYITILEWVPIADDIKKHIILSYL